MKKTVFLSMLIAGCVSVGFAQHTRSSFYNTPYESRNSGSFNMSTGLISIGYGFPNDLVSSYNNGTGGVSRVNFGPAVCEV